MSQTYSCTLQTVRLNSVNTIHAEGHYTYAADQHAARGKF